jgi:hypothetical protein
MGLNGLLRGQMYPLLLTLLLHMWFTSVQITDIAAVTLTAKQEVRTALKDIFWCGIAKLIVWG